MCLHILYCDLSFINREETKQRMKVYEAEIHKEMRDKERQEQAEKQKALQYKKTYKPRTEAPKRQVELKQSQNTEPPNMKLDTRFETLF